MEMARRTQPDAAKVFAAIAAIMSRRDGRRVQVVSVTKAGAAAEKEKAFGYAWRLPKACVWLSAMPETLHREV